MERLDPPEIECLVGDSEWEWPPQHPGSHESEASPRRMKVLIAMSMLVVVFLSLNGLPTSTDAQSYIQSSYVNHTAVEIPHEVTPESLSTDHITDNSALKAKNATAPPATSSSYEKSKDNYDTAIDISLSKNMKSATKKAKKPKGVQHTCRVPTTDTDKAPKLTSSSSSTSFSKCSKHMGLQLPDHNRKALVKHLPMNPMSHLFTFPHDIRDDDGLRPLLCVPQKNGNLQFRGFVYAAWNKKAPKSGYDVHHDMSHWQRHNLVNSAKSHQTHVYFVARNPYTRILSMYLHKVVNACISDGKDGCDTHGWHLIKRDTSFKIFVEIIEKKVAEKGSLCAISHHLCQQVETCLTTTLHAKAITVIRVEEESCWFPCLAKQVGMKTTLLNKGWDEFSGHSCYYTSTGECDDMLRVIDPEKVDVVTGNVHATGASNRLAEHYDSETAAIVSRLYAEDFRVLGYPLWDGESEM